MTLSNSVHQSFLDTMFTALFGGENLTARQRSCCGAAGAVRLIIGIITLALWIWILFGTSFHFSSLSSPSDAFVGALENTSVKHVLEDQQLWARARKGRQDNIVWLSRGSAPAQQLTQQDVFLSVPSRCVPSQNRSSGGAARITWWQTEVGADSHFLTAPEIYGDSFNASAAHGMRLSETKLMADGSPPSSSSRDAICAFVENWRNDTSSCDRNVETCREIVSPSYAGADVALLLVRAVNGSEYFSASSCNSATTDDTRDLSSALAIEIIAADRRFMVLTPSSHLLSEMGFFGWSGAENNRSEFSALIPAGGFLAVAAADSSSSDALMRLNATVVAAVRMWFERRRRSFCDQGGGRSSSAAAAPAWTALLVTQGNLLSTKTTANEEKQQREELHLLLKNETPQSELYFIAIQNVTSDLLLLQSDDAENGVRAAIHVVSLVLSFIIVVWLCWLLYVGDGEPWQAAQCSPGSSAAGPLLRPSLLSTHVVTLPLALVQLVLVSDPSWIFTWPGAAEGGGGSSSSSMQKPRSPAGSLMGGAAAARWFDIFFRCFAVPSVLVMRWWLGDGGRADEEAEIDKGRGGGGAADNDAATLKTEDRAVVEPKEKKKKSATTSSSPVAAQHFLPSSNSNSTAKPLECCTLLREVGAPLLRVELRGAMLPLTVLFVTVFLHIFEAMSATFFSPALCSDDSSAAAAASMLVATEAATDPIGYTTSSSTGLATSAVFGRDSGLASSSVAFPIFSIVFLIIQVVPSLFVPKAAALTALFCGRAGKQQQQEQPQQEQRGTTSDMVIHNPERRRWLSAAFGAQRFLGPLCIVDAALVLFTALAAPPAFVVSASGRRLFVSGETHTLLTDQHNSAAACLYSLWRLLVLVGVLHPMPAFLRRRWVADGKAGDDATGWRQPGFAAMLHRGARLVIGRSLGNQCERTNPDDNVHPLSQAQPSQILTVAGSTDEADEENETPQKKEEKGDADEEESFFSFHQLLALPRPAVTLSKLAVVQPTFLPSSSQVDAAVATTLKTARAAVAAPPDPDGGTAVAVEEGPKNVLHMVLGQPRLIFSTRIKITNLPATASNPLQQQQKQQDEADEEPSPTLEASLPSPSAAKAQQQPQQVLFDTLSWFSMPRPVGRSKHDRGKEAQSVLEQLMLVRHRSSAAPPAGTSPFVAAAENSEEQQNSPTTSSPPPSAFPTGDDNDDDDDNENNDGGDGGQAVSASVARPEFEPVFVEALTTATEPPYGSVSTSIDDAISRGCAAVQNFCVDERRRSESNANSSTSLFFVDVADAATAAVANDDRVMTEIAARSLERFCCCPKSAAASEGKLHSGNISSCTVIDRGSAEAELGLKKVFVPKQQPGPRNNSEGDEMVHVFVIKPTTLAELFEEGQQRPNNNSNNLAPSQYVSEAARMPVLVTVVPCVISGNDVVAAPSRFVLELLAREYHKCDE